MGDSATFRLDGHVATITYNRPDALNAINAEMRRDLNDAFSRFRDDEDAWVAIVTGSGRAFCVGADLRDGAGSAGEFAGTFWEKPTLNSFESGWEIFKPVIAAVNGYCLGYGLTLATWCDFVLASDRAEFGLPEVSLGVPAIVASIRLPQRINWADAMELLLTGERIDAERAHAMGLVWRVVPHDALLDEANALARRLLSGAPLAQRAMKEMAMRTRHMATLEAIRFGETMRQVAGGPRTRSKVVRPQRSTDRRAGPGDEVRRVVHAAGDVDTPRGQSQFGTGPITPSGKLSPVRNLNKSQKVAVLAAIGFVFWVVGNYLHMGVFDSGVITYAPVSNGTNWTLIWHEAVQLAIWLVLAAMWLWIAIVGLRADMRDSE